MKSIKLAAASFFALLFFVSSANASDACACSEPYEVKPGDTLYSLAQQYGVTVEQIQNKNSMGTSTYIIAGEDILLPPEPIEDAEAQEPSAEPDSAVYVVESGDTLYNIAQSEGTTVHALQANNDIESDVIFPGQELTIQ
ncbi:LysM peptidoglycan-binding domain-containing protein [Thalassobacillus sp. C254]|uniref:LysM peptidoglycan-binding domain-containing protein n=1 Tax=Thalassobacillus sp. C254 TaxID=1225341 RepID=UPI0006CF5CF0|nr:LysM peptidoglycan-binding domain-containing protein [Thalassobacillus sp. C254]